MTDEQKYIQEQKYLIKNTSTFSIFTIFSRIIGFLRDILRSFAFGTSFIAVAFDIAFRIPNMFRSLVAEGAMTQALLPVYEEYKRKGRDESQKAIGSLIVFITIILTLLSISAWFILPEILPWLTNDTLIEYPQTKLAIRLSQILFPYLLFISLCSVYVAVQYSNSVFWPGSFGPALLNIIVVSFFGIYFFFLRNDGSYIKDQDIYIFSYIILSSSIIQLIFQSYVLRKHNIRPQYSFRISHPIVKSLFVLMLPAIFGVAVRQLSQLTDIYLATLLKDEIPEAISALTYAQRLIQMPMGIFGVAISTAIMPLLSKHFYDKKESHFLYSLSLSIRLLLFLMLPSSIGLIVYPESIVSLVYERGYFDEQSTEVTSIAVRYYAIGISFFAVQKLLISAFYARKKMKEPALVAAVLLVLNVVFSLYLMRFLQHGGLALGSSLSAFCGMVIYLFLIYKKFPPKAKKSRPLKADMLSFLKLFLVNLLFCLFLLGIKKNYFGDVVASNILFIMPLAVLVYIGLALLLKTEELRLLKGLYGRKKG